MRVAQIEQRQIQGFIHSARPSSGPLLGPSPSEAHPPSANGSSCSSKRHPSATRAVCRRCCCEPLVRRDKKDIILRASPSSSSCFASGMLNQATLCFHPVSSPFVHASSQATCQPETACLVDEGVCHPWRSVATVGPLVLAAEVHLFWASSCFHRLTHSDISTNSMGGGGAATVLSRSNRGPLSVW